uniref:CCDC92 domain-containing protein n=1 Tax=Rhabditophanes sp. KR3021 TaxID=114890 RepID=A0AC35TXZ3_9BILA
MQLSDAVTHVANLHHELIDLREQLANITKGYNNLKKELQAGESKLIESQKDNGKLREANLHLTNDNERLMSAIDILRQATSGIPSPALIKHDILAVIPKVSNSNYHQQQTQDIPRYAINQRQGFDNSPKSANANHPQPEMLLQDIPRTINNQRHELINSPAVTYRQDKQHQDRAGRKPNRRDSRVFADLTPDSKRTTAASLQTPESDHYDRKRPHLFESILNSPPSERAKMSTSYIKKNCLGNDKILNKYY